MKKLFLALVVLVGLGSTAMAQSKMAHVNSQKLWDTLPSGKAAQLKLEEFEKEYIEQYQALEESYQKMVMEYQAMMKAPEPPSDVRRQFAERNIQQKEVELQQFQQVMQYDMQKRQNELESPIIARIKKAVKIVADRKKLEYVIDINSAVYVNGLDITDEVIVELLKLEAEAAKAAATPATPTTPGAQ